MWVSVFPRESGRAIADLSPSAVAARNAAEPAADAIIPLSRVPFWARLVVLAVANFGLCWLGLALTPGPSRVALFWPAAGLAAGALLLSDRRRWVAILAAAGLPIAAFNITAGQAPIVVATFAITNVGSALLSAWLTLRLCGGRPQPLKAGHVLAFIAAGPLVATGTCELLSAATLSAVYGLPLPEIWLRLWAGSGLGMLTVGSLLLAWAEPRGEQNAAARPSWLERLALLASLSLAAWLIFLRPDRGPLSNEIVLLPPAVWAAFRFGLRGGTVVGLLMTLVALSATAAGRGVFALEARAAQGAVEAQVFSFIAVVTELFMASLVEAHRRGVAALRESERSLRLAGAAVDCAADFIVFVDAAGRVVYANDALAAVAGKPRERLVGMNVWELPGSTVDEAWWRAHWRRVREQRFLRWEMTAAIGGKIVPVAATATYIAFAGNEYAVQTAHDLTERRNAEASLRLAGIGTLAAGMAHEINNPLSYVLANQHFVAERLRAMLSGETAVPPDLVPELVRADEATREALDGANRVRVIVHDLKAFSRAPDDAPPSPVDVVQAARSAINLSRNEVRHRARLVTDLDPVPPVLADERRLAQVLLNLLINAAQAIPDGHAADHEIGVSTRAAGGEVVVKVSDTGCGMTPEVRARIFEPFFTTKPVGAGTGLGLSICHGIVTSLRGRIEVDSAPGRGSVFRVVLPATVGSTQMASQVNTPPPTTPARILVVDDDALVAAAIRRVLSPPHRVEAILDPHAALDRIQASDEFDLVLCDVMMPEMSGMEFQERLSASAPGLARGMMFMTGGAFTEQARQFLHQSRNPRVDKPFDADDLRRRVAQALAASRRPPTVVN